MASAAARNRSTTTKSSLPGDGRPGGTTGSSGASARTPRLRRTSSTPAASRRPLSLDGTPVPLADHDAQRDQRRAGHEPADQAFGDGPDVAERQAAAVVGAL